MPITYIWIAVILIIFPLALRSVILPVFVTVLICLFKFGQINRRRGIVYNFCKYSVITHIKSPNCYVLR